MFGVMGEAIMVILFYIGAYKNDKKHGFGKYRWADGREYVGFWENGKQHGYGKYILHGQSQIGVWSKGKRSSWLTQTEIEDIAKDPKYKVIFLN